MTHQNPGRIAGKPPRRSGRNAHATIEQRLAGLIGVGQSSGVNVHDDLIAFAGSPGIDAVVERGLGRQRQRVGLQLLHQREIGIRRCLTALLVQAAPRRQFDRGDDD